MTRDESLLLGPLRPNEIAACAALVADEPNFAPYRIDAVALARSLELAVTRGDELLTLQRDAGIVGVAWLMPAGAFGRSPYLRLIALHAELQGRGAGGRLLAAVEAAARPHGDDLFLLVSASNAGARRFYARHGYEAIGTLHGYVVPDVDEVLMRKRLRETPT